ncbi:hypothetical protein JBF12_48815, partial [Streptomyces javensis]|nr:hypothetical protein [Streptomyces javensis]
YSQQHIANHNSRKIAARLSIKPAPKNAVIVQIVIVQNNMQIATANIAGKLIKGIDR